MIEFVFVLVFLALIGIVIGVFMLIFSEDENLGLCIGVISAVALLSLGLGGAAGHESVRRAAIKAGAAEYKVTPNKDGAAKVEFVWKGTNP